MNVFLQLDGSLLRWVLLLTEFVIETLGCMCRCDLRREHSCQRRRPAEAADTLGIIADSCLAQILTPERRVLGVHQAFTTAANVISTATTPARTSSRPVQGKKTPPTGRAGKRQYIDEDINDDFCNGQSTTAKRKRDHLVEAANGAVSGTTTAFSNALSHQASLDRVQGKVNTQLVLKGQADIFNQVSHFGFRGVECMCKLVL